MANQSNKSSQSDLQQRITEIRNNKSFAHVLPLAVFMGLSFIFSIICESDLFIFDRAFYWDHDVAPWWRHWPEHWFYPIQTVICGGLVIFFWKHYEIKWDKRIIFGAIMGVIGIAFWILPTHLYTALGYTEDTVGWLKHIGFEERTKGFNPADMGNSTGYWFSIIFRFLRAVVVVSLVEEILWRGFLMRFLLNRDGDYWKVPFGKFSWLTFFVVTGAFVLIHAPVDYAGAVIYGSLTYFVAVKTKSLAACIVMHGVANLIMGLYALEFGKYGLW